MSHEATTWAFKVQGLCPSQKLVLLCLADCHNPVYGCFPSQQFVADTAGVSRSTVNNVIKALEDLNLIVRERRYDDKTKHQKSTKYILAFEDDFPVSKNYTRVNEAVSNLEGEPCPNKGLSRVQNLDTNLVIEPVIELVSGNEVKNDDLKEKIPSWIREIVVKIEGEGWAKSYIDPSTYDPLLKTIYAATDTAVQRIKKLDALRKLNIKTEKAKP